jgi:hypothetical protein
VNQLLESVGAGRSEVCVGCLMSVDTGFDRGFVDKTFEASASLTAS